MSSSSLSGMAADDTRKAANVEQTIVEDVLPADIPLPIGARDVDEIEVPGLASYSDDDSEDGDEDVVPARPKSFYAAFPSSFDLPKQQENSNSSLPAFRPRQRSTSLPVARARVFDFPREQIPFSDAADEANRGDDQLDEELVSDLSGDEQLVVNRSTGPEPTGLGLSAAPKSLISKKASTDSVADDLAWDSEGPDEVATYEKAEVVTSSRVSVDSSPSSSDDSSKRGHKRSTSSMHSARIVDVQAPRSSGSSPRPGSIDIAHRRSTSLSSAAALAGAIAGAAGVAGAGAAMASKMGRDASPIDKASPELPTPLVRAPVERAKQTARGAATISESEEEADYHGAHGKDIIGAAPSRVRSNEGTNSKLSPRAGMRLDVEKATRSGLIDREPLSPRLVNTSYDGRPSPNPAIKTPTSPGPRHLHGFRENKAPPTLEKLRTQEEVDAFATPLHSIAPPRAIHTSGSSASSITGKAKAVRSSEDNSSTSRSESVARNFEDLIQSNQTITYTLTPESMRHVDSSKRSLDGPVVTKFSRRQSEDARSPSTSQPSTTAGGSPPVIREPGFKSTAVPEGKPSGPVPRAPTGIAVTTGRINGPQARDARVSADTTSDFAQFIKSTGPAPESRQPPLSSRSNDTTNFSGTIPRASSSARRASNISNKGRFQPREAAVTNKSDTRELIDFIRQGPPIAASNHRIPRHVAPFRTTMDSDQLAGVPGGKAIDASIPEVRYDVRYSQASTNVTDNSMQSSMNSNSALLKGRSGSSKIASMFGEEDAPMPQRTTRRVRDPYALDFSDEEDEEGDEMQVAPRRPAKEEESLAEFLRNYDPPGEAASISPNVPKKKASAPSLMGRFTRSNPSKDTASIASTEARSLSSRAGGGARGYVPIQVSMPPGYDKYGPIEPQSSTARARLPSISGSSARVPMKKFEPREPSTYRSETSDLADFLRSSGPPGGSTAPAVQPIRQEESGNSLSRMFGRRKKTFT
ncbi:hypothetical protein NQ176_g9113 [Zarea fungicola]|uniref:Uncharacterized protein n=1 Tax=Zarea fungicola TaxID=93591 RepID=A0ACC1MQL9_9HYPO|nr:hypothetical protein NQ176_g9113 [Lecanicillium fungicola]